MSDLKVFFNTRIANAGFLSGVGNAGLLPLQYLCLGDKVTITTEPGYKITMTSYFIWSKRLDNFCLRMLKTLAAVALLVPGLLLSLFKLAAYASSDVRKTHALVKETIALSNDPARRTRTIGSQDEPITSIGELTAKLREAAAEAETQNFPDNLTGALIIYGNGNLEILKDPGILTLDPKRLILIGAKIVHKGCDGDCLDDRLSKTGRLWAVSSAFPQQNDVDTLDKALRAPNEMSGGSPHRMIYTLNKRISLDDVAQIKVGQVCKDGSPCF